MTKRFAWIIATALALGLGGPVAAQQRTAPDRITPVEKPAPQPDGRGVIWAENEEI
ncbi:hypothetical protein N8I71_15730 [Roseibacterium sp. SDUM158016]|uniref:hypothetical protein n=1 Tax=Roseicyclus sediminis TaxID=2980997 RepID=UPI0021D2CC9F|nr:hypothetical protein [Roseibacterium sp. SDUM158016]MCU4654292.1 hypothetical protein [Roseibacterium sp. SDUM158016]